MSRIRKNSQGHILLLNSGRIATTTAYCMGHISCYTDQNQHPSCVDFSLTGGREFQAASVVGNKISCSWTVGGYAGSFWVLCRWVNGHSPYPEIQNMEFIIFGYKVAMSSYPMYPSAFRRVAFVEIFTDGMIMVNGTERGIFPEFANTNKGG